MVWLTSYGGWSYDFICTIREIWCHIVLLIISFKARPAATSLADVILNRESIAVADKFFLLQRKITE